MASPRGVGPYANIRGVVFAPQTGRVWVAAQGIVQEVDVFLRDPVVVRTITGFTKPSISRVTSDGRLLVVDSVNGVDKVYQIDVNSGAVTEFAQTKDDQFTRNILPGGIAVAPDGSACFIADHSQNRVVRIPAGAGPGSSTINDTWGGRTFSFADPAGMDAYSAEKVVIANQDQWPNAFYMFDVYENWAYTDTTYAVPAGVRSVEIDRDVMVDSSGPRFLSLAAGMAQVFNHNSIDGAPARYHGGVLAEHYGATGHCGGAGQPPCCGESGELPCNQVMAYAWQNAAAQDTVVFFDPTIEATFALGTAGAQHLQRTVVEVSSPDAHGLVTLTLNEPLGLSLWASPPETTIIPHQPTFAEFAEGKGAGYGALTYRDQDDELQSCDSRLYGQAINAEGSCYYDADLGGVERSFADAFTELRAVIERDGVEVASPLPFIAEEWFGLTLSDDFQHWLLNLSRTWNGHRGYEPGGVFHAIGVDRMGGNRVGRAIYYSQMRTIFVAPGFYAAYPWLPPNEVKLAISWTTNHELGHLFGVNMCSSTGGHDSRPAWCDQFNKCGLGTHDQRCVMVSQPSWQERTDGVMRFCIEDLFSGDPNCVPGTGHPGRNTAIRTHDDFGSPQ